jgi:hypothetical protein
MAKLFRLLIIIATVSQPSLVQSADPLAAKSANPSSAKQPLHIQIPPHEPQKAVSPELPLKKEGHKKEKLIRKESVSSSPQ